VGAVDEPLRDSGYDELVARLLALDEPSLYRDAWLDYSALGLGAEHVPDLIRMASDDALHTAASDNPLVWAPDQAWRALGQLRAESAVEPLVGLFSRADEQHDEWLCDDLPKVMALIGPVAIPALVAYVQDATHGVWARISASKSFAKIGLAHPEVRETCVAALSNQLAQFAENGEDVNAFLISWLLDLNATEAAPVMEQAFAADAVDLSVQGDWEEVQIELGLLDKRITPRPRTWFLWQKPTPTAPPPSGKAQEKSKKKKKDQKKARKRNRRK